MSILEKAEKAYEWLKEKICEDNADMLWNWLGCDPFAEIYEGAVADGYIDEEEEEDEDDDEEEEDDV